MDLIFEKSSAGHSAVSLPKNNLQSIDLNKLIPREMRRKTLDLPELSEIEIVRHFTALSRRSFGVDNSMYPLGSCTMKYNPKINEEMCSLPGFTKIHPLSESCFSQGSLQIIFELQEMLKEITGMDAVTLQPAAGAHGELTGVMIMQKYFQDKGESRTKILIPDSGHGTNPASVNMCGLEAINLTSNTNGNVDIEELKQVMTKDVAGIMLTIPNTLGLFDPNIKEIAEIVHNKGGLFYMDGANLNAIIGLVKPADMGIDILHINLHKTFSTPHGGGGPGSGPVGVVSFLKDFLPKPQAVKEKNKYKMSYNIPKSIGRVRAFYGNFGVLVRAYTYIRILGPDGLKDVAKISVLNANYIKESLKDTYNLPYSRHCMHECVLNDKNQEKFGVTTSDIAKRILDYNFHAPTIYFPLIIHGSIMIEPTETESKATLDEFISVMKKIADEAKTIPDLLKTAPHKTPVKKVDGVLAARNPKLVHKKMTN